MNAIELLPVGTPATDYATPYSTIRVHDDAVGDVHWLHMHADAGPGVRPCFRKPLMTEMHAYLDGISGDPQARPGRLRHLVPWPFTCSP